MNMVFYAMLTLLLLPANFMVLKFCLNRSSDWPNKKVFELTMVMWAMALMTCAILKESSVLDYMS